jgi:hypothetical protein
MIAETSGISVITSSLSSLITVVLMLTMRMDLQQEQLTQLQGVIQPAMDPSMPTTASGTIPKHQQIYPL